MGFSKKELERCRGATVPDLIGPGCKLLFVGINPGLWTAMTGVHFAHPSNRFWPALRKAGLIDFEPNIDSPTPAVRLPEAPEGKTRDQSWTATNTHLGHPSNRSYPALRKAGLIDRELHPETGMTDDQRTSFLSRGFGITNLVPRATARAAELDPQELVEGAERVERLAVELRPAVVAVAGITAYRIACRRPKAETGEQPEQIGPSALWVVPNPSGLNAHETLTSLAAWYRQAAEAAWIV